MTDPFRPDPGTINHIDLTVPNADEVRDFYKAVAGWTHRGEDMGDYQDYHMVAPGGQTVAGIVHARGINADNPAQWLIHISVEDLDASMTACKELGGKILLGPSNLGPWGDYCIIEDPAGAVSVLIQPAG